MITGKSVARGGFNVSGVSARRSFFTKWDEITRCDRAREKDATNRSRPIPRNLLILIAARPDRTAANDQTAHVIRTAWRRARDSNPRYPFGYAGFQDRSHQPLGHLSRCYSFTIVLISPEASPQEISALGSEAGWPFSFPCIFENRVVNAYWVRPNARE